MDEIDIQITTKLEKVFKAWVRHQRRQTIWAVAILLFSLIPAMYVIHTLLMTLAVIMSVIVLVVIQIVREHQNSQGKQIDLITSHSSFGQWLSANKKRIPEVREFFELVDTLPSQKKVE